MKLNMHARIEIAAILLIALTSCSNKFQYQFNDKERDEIEDLAGDVAYDVVLEHENVKALERRVAEIEAKLNM
jgi:polyhydroxyalkanoate synthesis regulator phasin